MLKKTCLVATVALAWPLLANSQPAPGNTAKTTCDATTLHGVYVYAYTGFTTSGRITRFAVAGWAIFNGDGTLQGVSTTVTQGQTASQVPYTGTYTVNSNCIVAETDTDQNGNVTHYDDFTAPDGNKISFVETDPNVVSSGSETRQSEVQ